MSSQPPRHPSPNPDQPEPRAVTKVRRVLARGSYTEAVRIAAILRQETVGGFILVAAAVLAMIAANSPLSELYQRVGSYSLGYAPWHLELDIQHWAADGLLAIFFFLVGLELKREFVAGDLRSPSTALVPVAAAVGGVVVPALIYLAVNPAGSTARGWAIPTATDIAFAVAVLAVIGSNLPSALRLFLLTLAVVNDLIAITIIAIGYTQNLTLTPLLIGLVPLAVYALLARRCAELFGRHPWVAWLILSPLGVVFWALVHASGIHATIAGVLLGFMVPVLKGAAHSDAQGLAEILEHQVRPLSTGLAVPVFAFFSAGVTVGGLDALRAAATDPVVIGIVAGLVLGKPIGILFTTWLVTRVTRAELDASLRWIDLLGMSMLAGIGFTVSLLISELSFSSGSEHTDHAKLAVLTASLVAALLASALLVSRNRRYRALAEEEAVDADGDGIPDVYQRSED